MLVQVNPQAQAPTLFVVERGHITQMQVVQPQPSKKQPIGFAPPAR